MNMRDTTRNLGRGDHGRNLGLSRVIILAVWSACALAQAASSASDESSELAGYVTVRAGSATRIIPIGQPTDAFRAGARWHVTKRLVIRDVSPLWRKADGNSLSSDAAYRGRTFNADGDLVGRAVDMIVNVELWAKTPRHANGICASLRIDDFVILAHKYQTRWGAVKSVDEKPTEIGRLPARTLVLRSGFSRGSKLSVEECSGEWEAKAGRRDVVRMAGCAFGMGCSYSASLECFGRGATPMTLATAAAPTAARNPAAILASATK